MSTVAAWAAATVAEPLLGMSGPALATVAGFDGVAFGAAVILSLLSGGVIAAVLKHLHDRKKLPIEREAMLATASGETVRSVLAALQSADRRLGRAERRLRRVERKLSKLQRAYETLLGWALHLVEHWPVLRQNEAPPIIPTLALLDLAEDDREDDVEDEPPEDTGEHELIEKHRPSG